MPKHSAESFCVACVCCVSLIAGALSGAEAGSETHETAVVYPNGLCIDRSGDLYISDIGAHRILKLDAQGKLSVFAGTGEAGYGGDGGPASAARLKAPHDLLLDTDGNLLIADTFNHRIRRVDARGVVTTIVGDGRREYSNQSTTALAVSLNNPQSIALDPGGNLLIADTYNHVVRRVDRKGNVTTFAGNEAGLAGDGGPAAKAQLNLPQAVAVAPDGSVYISDAANSRIRRVDLNGVIETIAGSGPGSGEGGAGFAGDGGTARKAKLFSPTDLKFDPFGKLYVSDSGNNRIRLIAHGVIVTVAGSGSAGFAGEGSGALEARFNAPQKIAIAKDGSVYIADRVNRRVRRVDRRGLVSTVLGGGDSGGILIDPTIPPNPGKRRGP